MTNKKIDLHNHSTASDGTYTPERLAYHAYNSGLAAAAVTDHDTVDGVEEFVSVCGGLGIEGIPGVEISAAYEVEMHIVGLYIDYKNTALIKKLDCLKQARISRNHKMLLKLREHGFDISEEDIVSQKDKGQLKSCGRAHIAGAMTEKGYTDSIQECFDKYIGKGASCYVERETFSVSDSIDLIKKAGGLAVLAHPVYITRDEDKLRALLKSLKGKGLDGVECYYSGHTKAYAKTVLSIAHELELLPSGGSDFHGDNRTDVKMGVVCSDMSVPYDLLEGMKKKLNM